MFNKVTIDLMLGAITDPEALLTTTNALALAYARTPDQTQAIAIDLFGEDAVALAYGALISERKKIRLAKAAARADARLPLIKHTIKAGYAAMDAHYTKATDLGIAEIIENGLTGGPDGQALIKAALDQIGSPLPAASGEGVYTIASAPLALALDPVLGAALKEIVEAIAEYRITYPAGRFLNLLLTIVHPDGYIRNKKDLSGLPKGSFSTRVGRYNDKGVNLSLRFDANQPSRS